MGGTSLLNIIHENFKRGVLRLRDMKKIPNTSRLSMWMDEGFQGAHVT